VACGAALAWGRGRDDARAAAGRLPGAVEALRLIRRDPLTNLANRVLFDELLTAHVAEGRAGAVLLLDIDDFGALNDALGFAAGDVLLQQVSDRLRLALGNVGALAHLFSDDFAILTAEPAAEVEAFALRLLRVFETPFLGDGYDPMLNSRMLSASVGIALVPAHGTDCERLLQAANQALRAAQASGRGGWRIFGDIPTLTEAGLAAALPAALAAGQIVPYYQPVVDIVSGQVTGMEVLARWRHPELGLLRSSAFIGVAQARGQLGAVTRHLLERTAHDCAAWPQALNFAFNVAPGQLEDALDMIATLPPNAPLPAARIGLELTEAAPVGDITVARGLVAALRQHGVRMALDDFGAGYGNLHNLLGMPFDIVKIDQEFVGAVLSDPRAELCVESIARGARAMGIEVVAEGVKSPEVAARVAALGCRFVQGSLFSMPVPANEVPAVLMRLGLYARGPQGGWTAVRVARAA
jgi:diguanylate cyclase (GGDEF)-like protein